MHIAQALITPLICLGILCLPLIAFLEEAAEQREKRQNETNKQA